MISRGQGDEGGEHAHEKRLVEDLISIEFLGHGPAEPISWTGLPPSHACLLDCFSFWSHYNCFGRRFVASSVKQHGYTVHVRSEAFVNEQSVLVAPVAGAADRSCNWSSCRRGLGSKLGTTLYLVKWVIVS